MTHALRHWQTWGWIALGLGATYIAYLLVSGLLTPAAPTAPGDTEMTMRGIAAQGQSGRNGWKFVAATSEISPDGYTTTYHDVKNATFMRNGKVTYRLTAGLVTVDSRNQNYSASAGVHVWSTMPALPEDLTTDSAYWDQAAQSLTCTTATRFVYHRTVMHTSHMIVNVKTGASELGDTTIDYSTPQPSPTPSVSVTPM